MFSYLFILKEIREHKLLVTLLLTLHLLLPYRFCFLRYVILQNLFRFILSLKLERFMFV